MRFLGGSARAVQRIGKGHIHGGAFKSFAQAMAYDFVTHLNYASSHATRNSYLSVTPQNQIFFGRRIIRSSTVDKAALTSGE